MANVGTDVTPVPGADVAGIADGPAARIGFAVRA